MINKSYAIYTAAADTFEKMCRSLLQQIVARKDVLTIVFFGAPQSNSEYLAQLDTLRRTTREYYPESTPLVSYVAQKPHVGMLNAEATYINPADAVRVRAGENYLILESDGSRELIIEGIIAPDISAPILRQSNTVFERIEQILATEGFAINSIARQWNYIENITAFDGTHQHYQDFNDARSHFYAKVEWKSGYPAATGIGTQFGGVMIKLIAVSGGDIVNRAIDNPLQVAAHNYSQSVLLGEEDAMFRARTTPKFERARAIGDDSRQSLFISGTAAIRGEQSAISDDITEQARLTMENIDYLISAENYPALPHAEREYKILRVYIKHPEQTPQVCRFMNEHYPDTEKFYVSADICRDELLLEIEGIAEIKKPIKQKIK